MKIGIDCRMWAETGIGRYIRNVVSNLAQIDKKNQYTLFVLDKDIDQIQLPGNFTKVRANIRWHTFAEQFVLPFIYYKNKLDILFVPHFNVPILYLGKLVSTVHDLTILRVSTGRSTTLPYSFYLFKRLAFMLTLFSTLVKSKKIFTVTEFVKADLVKTFKIQPQKILMTFCAVDSSFQRVSYGDLLPVFQKYNVMSPYIFYVGNAHPHKNLESLLKAFEYVNEKKPELSLVLGGSKKFFYERLEREWKDSAMFGKVKFIGYVDDNDLPALYSGAEAFVNPSKYEGFGIQILEAFACGTKVISSNSTSLPEIGGSGAYYFDPSNPKEISEVILRALDDSNFEEKREYGYKRVKGFSWLQSAQTVLETINSIK